MTTVRNHKHTVRTLLMTIVPGPMTWGCVLDKIHWFSGVAKGDKSIQRELVVSYADTMLRKNATQALNEQRPLIYKEALDEARMTCQRMNCDESLLLVETYTSKQKGKGGGGGGANLNGPFNGAQNTGKGGNRGRGGHQRGSGGRGSGGGANLNAAPTQSAYGSVDDQFKQQERQTCVHWNMRTCRNEMSCNKLHKCSYPMGNGRICWDQVNTTNPNTKP